VALHEAGAPGNGVGPRDVLTRYRRILGSAHPAVQASTQRAVTYTGRTPKQPRTRPRNRRQRENLPTRTRQSPTRRPHQAPRKPHQERDRPCRRAPSSLCLTQGFNPCSKRAWGNRTKRESSTSTWVARPTTRSTANSQLANSQSSHSSHTPPYSPGNGSPAWSNTWRAQVSGRSSTSEPGYLQKELHTKSSKHPPRATATGAAQWIATNCWHSRRQQTAQQHRHGAVEAGERPATAGISSRSRYETRQAAGRDDGGVGNTPVMWYLMMRQVQAELPACPGR
jgi:hypothetical protein